MNELEELQKKIKSAADAFQYRRARGESAWNEDTIRQFRDASLEELVCGKYFLNMKEIIRPKVLEDIYELWEERKKRRIHLVCFKEGIGSGKTEKASIIMWLQWFELCLLGETPQKHFRTNSTIAFLCSSYNESQAKRVAFSKVFGKFLSDFNKDYFPINPKYITEIRVARNDTCVYPGNSSALSIQGYDYFGGIMDEASSMERTEHSKKAIGEQTLFDAAEELETAISLRMSSRFQEQAGMLVATSSDKYEDDFLDRKRKEFELLGKDSFIFYKERTLYEGFKISNVYPFKTYNVNVENKYKSVDGYFYIDVDVVKEVSKEVADLYFSFIDKLRKYRNSVLKYCKITIPEYEECQRVLRVKEQN